MTDNKYRIAIIGGTGAEGSGLAIRWAKAGHQPVTVRHEKRSSPQAVPNGAPTR